MKKSSLEKKVANFLKKIEIDDIHFNKEETDIWRIYVKLQEIKSKHDGYLSFDFANKEEAYVLRALVIPYPVMKRAILCARSFNYDKDDMERLISSFMIRYQCKDIEIVKRMNDVAFLNDHNNDEMMEIYGIDVKEDDIYKRINPVKLSMDANKVGEKKEPIDFLLDTDKKTMVTFSPLIKH